MGTQSATTSSYKTQLSLTAATALLRRGKIFDLLIGTIGTPADQTYEFDVSRQTAAGTGGTTIVALPEDTADAAAGTVTYGNPTAEPTYTASSSVWYLGINQRASYRWVASQGSELVWPATNLVGLGTRCRSVSGGTVLATVTALFQEQ